MSDPLLANKIAAAALTAGLLFFGIPQLATRIIGGEEHHGTESGELKLAYPIEIKTSAPGSGEAAAELDLGTLLASASAAGGERRAGLCKSCHTVDKGGANGTGPNLWGIVGRPVASHAGFSYTAALKAAGGEWTYDRLDKFIRNSQEYVPGTAMVQHFPKAEQRADILAYLSTLSEDAAPFPAPAPAAEAPVEMPQDAAAPAAKTAPDASADGTEVETKSSE